MKFRNTKVGIAVLAIFAAVMLTAGSCDESSGVAQNEEQTDRQLNQYNQAQPVPFFNWSQFRQSVIDVETAKANGVATTSFFFNAGVTDPVDTCPSIGYPIPSTTQITNPDQIIWRTSSGGYIIPQMEPNGTYTGESTATYVICVASNGDLYPSYWEGFIKTEGGPAVWNYDLKRIEMVGDPTVEMSEGSDQ